MLEYTFRRDSHKCLKDALFICLLSHLPPFILCRVFEVWSCLRRYFKAISFLGGSIHDRRTTKRILDKPS